MNQMYFRYFIVFTCTFTNGTSSIGNCIVDLQSEIDSSEIILDTQQLIKDSNKDYEKVAILDWKRLKNGRDY